MLRKRPGNWIEPISTAQGGVNRPYGRTPPRTSIKELANAKKTVLKVGAVHEYNADGSYNYTAHVEAQLQCLETLDPENAAPIRARFDAIKQRPYGFNGGDHINKVARDVSHALVDLAPAGMYYGLPRNNCNIAGFWPCFWLNAAKEAIGPRNAEVRELGACEIG